MKYLILGAGPAGLSFANRIFERSKECSFLVLEAEREAGGLCKSKEIDGSPLDIGGGHFLDTRRPNVNEFLFNFLPENEWNTFDRNSMICIKGKMINHPFEANIWQLDVTEQVEYLKSIAMAGCNTGQSAPALFTDWIYWKLGDKIANDYMIPYNQKVFGENLNQLGTYWLEKLPNVSFEETILSCLTRKAYGTEPGHSRFLYPKKYGYGEVWNRMAQNIKDYIEYGKVIKSIDFDKRMVTTSDGDSYAADVIISTIPWMEFEQMKGIPENIKKGIDQLRYSSIQIEYKDENISSDAQWIYYPNLELDYHRILVRKNFCPNSRGYWTETNLNRVGSVHGMQNSFSNKYAYPLNTINKPEIVNRLLTWARSKSVFGLGRWGEWSHYNSDVVVELGINLADKLTM
ncbi:Protoporphyrinogen oxidase [Lachnospiraceae bacterium G11]|nr:Protoporphyrinogen oxidase [Lachnospiraceae bacterium G11]